MKTRKMKRTTIYGLYAALACLAFPSCSKFLEVEPEEVLVKEQMYRNIYDADAAVIGIYGKLLSLAEQHVLWNELRADLLTVTKDRKSTRLNSSHVKISY